MLEDDPAGDYVELPELPQGDADAKRCFEDQIRTTEDAATALRNELNHLRALQSTESELSEQDNEDFQNKMQHLDGALECYRGIRRLLKSKDLAIQDEYDDLEPGQRKDRLISIYNRMSRLAERVATNMYKLLGVENSSFSARIMTYKRWIAENPVKALGIVGVCAGSISGALAVLSDSGIHVFLDMGLVHHALTVGKCALVGGLVGLIVGSIIVFAVNAARSTWTEEYEAHKAKSQIQRVNEMVEALKNMPDQYFLQELENLEEMCNELNGTIPNHDDRMCNICLSEGREVVAPIKTPGCRGMHFMCKNHWRQYTDGRDAGNIQCPVCRQ